MNVFVKLQTAAAAAALSLVVKAAEVYSVPDGERIYGGYAVEVDGAAAPVSEVRCSAMPFNRRWPGRQRQIEQSELCGMVRFAFEGKATVKVTAAKDFKTVKVRPLSRNVAVSREGRTISFDVTRPGGYSVEFDGYHNNLHVFADAGGQSSKAADSAAREAARPPLVFGPGIHDIGIRQLKSGDAVYIDPGAIVYGAFHASNATDVAIFGRGILDAGRLKEKILFAASGDGQEAVKNAKRWHTIDMRNCRNVRIDGIVIRDSLLYNIAMYGCEDVAVSGVKIVGQWRFNTDGIDLHNCRRVRVKDSFARTFDDTFCFKAHEGYGNTEDCTFERCVAWTDWGKTFEVGVECRAEHLRRLAFRDCDCIHAVGAVLDVMNVDYGRVSDVVYDDIRIECDEPMPRPQLQKEDGSVFNAKAGLGRPPCFFQAGVEFHHEYSMENGGKWGAGGFIDGVTVRNASVSGANGRKPSVRIVALDEKHRPENIVFEGCTVDGKPLRGREEVALSLVGPAVPPAFAAPAGDAEKMNSGMMNPGSALRTVERIGGGDFRVLVYGNSIALHAPKPDIGWTNDWGMAASAPEKDFAHLVVAGLEAKLGKKADFRIRNIAALERNFTTNLATVAEISEDAAWKPDYVVIAVGENVPNIDSSSAAAFRKFLSGIARPFTDAGSRVVMRSPFWRNDVKAECTKEAAAEVGATYVDAGPLGAKEENKAIGLFAHSGVANHPGDLGMRRLADLIIAGFDGIEVADGVKWIDGRSLPIEGRAFDDVDNWYDRLPAGVTTNVNGGVRSMKHHTAGMQFRFATDSRRLVFKWTPFYDKLAADHMPASSYSGIDVYRFDAHRGKWLYVKTGRITDAKGGKLELGWTPGTPCLANLPLYNGIKSFKLGIETNAVVSALGPRKSGVERPVVFYGTSITHGGCASRPGMSFVNIVGRDIDVPVVNLGFSGSGVMELEMSDILARIDASCYVLDCLWNMGTTTGSRANAANGAIAGRNVEENYEPFIRNLRSRRPDTPIVMAGQSDVFCGGANVKEDCVKALYDKLVAEGWKNLFFLPKNGMYCGDFEGTVDGIHPNDWGMASLAKAYGGAVAQALSIGEPRGTAQGYSVTVPVKNKPGLEEFGGREKVLSELRKLGASRVILSLGKYVFDGDKRANAMRALKENSDWFKSQGLSTCAWLWTFWGEDEAKPSFCRMTESNGAPGAFFCPLDGNFRKFAADYVADIARTGVDMILYDDDYGYRNHSAKGKKISCLCGKHLDAYRRELGEDVSADEFSRRAMSGGRNRWRDAWMKVNGESLVAFAKEMRASVDTVNPEIRFGLCSVMSIWDHDGTDAPTVARALAGPNTRPFLRLIGAPYWVVGPRYYDCRLQNVVELERMERSWVGGDVEVVAEGDTYPRPRHNCPAAHLELFDMAIRADGRMDGIMKYALDYNRHVDYERGYAIRHQRNAKTYDWIARNMSAKPAVGVRIYESLHKLRDAQIQGKGAGSTAIFAQFGSPAGKLIADASIPTVYEGEGICGAAFGENVKQVPKAAFARGLIIDRRGAELLEEMGVSAGLKEKGAAAPETYFHENADGGRFFVVNFDTKGPKGRGYDMSRMLADAVCRLSGKKPPAYVNGCPDLYVMTKRNGEETVIGLWNMFADSVLDGVVELDAPAGSVEFFNCTGRKEGDRLVIDEIAPFAFAGIRIDARQGRGCELSLP